MHEYPRSVEVDFKVKFLNEFLIDSCLANMLRKFNMLYFLANFFLFIFSVSIMLS